MVKERGWEGLVAKDPTAPYVGGSTQRWLKVKVRHEGCFHRGWRDAFRSQVTGLLVGEQEGGRLLYRGTVEWGLFRQVVTQLVVSVEGLVRPTSPFADLKRSPEVTWLEPRLLAEVSYHEPMEDRLRDPVLRELRVARWGASMKTIPENLDTLRTQLTDTIEHGTELLVGLKALNDSFPKLLPLLADLSERERATEIAVLCGFHPLMRTYLHQLIESLADVLGGLTAADGGEAWLRRQIDTLQTPGESSEA